MTIRKFLIYLFIAVCLLVIVPPLHADGNQQVNVIYQSAFSTDPRWITNNPSSDYWDPTVGMYHFSIEPSTGAYAYTGVNYNGGSFTLEYDVILNRIDDGATFRLGFSGDDMDPGEGPNALTEFTNDKFGQIMWLHMVSPGNKMVEVNSEHDDALSSGTIAYNGPTVKYELNTTYHVTMSYDADQQILSMKVNDKTSGNEILGLLRQHHREPQGNEPDLPWLKGRLWAAVYLCRGIHRQCPPDHPLHGYTGTDIRCHNNRDPGPGDDPDKNVDS